jgi:hypothetical protein
MPMDSRQLKSNGLGILGATGVNALLGDMCRTCHADEVGMNRGDRLQTDRGHGLHIDWGLCPGKMSYQWNRNNDLLIWRKADGLR